MDADELKICRPGLQHYVDRLNTGRLFSFSRWGDGEWRSLLKIRTGRTANCDKHRFFTGMGYELAEVLKKNPSYECGIQALALRCYGNRIRQFTARYCPQINWSDSDVFHHASLRGQLAPLFQALRRLPLLVAGPAYLRGLDKLLHFQQFVEVPQRNCYLTIARVEKQILQSAENMPKPFVCSLSASMPAEILLDKLYSRLGGVAFLIDFGSLYDPFVGHPTRKYHRNLSTGIRRRNLDGLE